MENLDKLDILLENFDLDYIIMFNVSCEFFVLDFEDFLFLFNLFMELIWIFLCVLCR